eukprot:7292199-Ditylum_brightwellii.AAC.1
MPMRALYRSELDITPVLLPFCSTYYQLMIEMLMWMIELGRIDIRLEVSLMSSHLAMPRTDHMSEVVRIFMHLRKHHNIELMFDPRKEEVPTNLPESRGMGFVTRANVDADHTGDSITRQFWSGFIIYLTSAPINWISKKETCRETNLFGSEFIAMKQCCGKICGL